MSETKLYVFGYYCLTCHVFIRHYPNFFSTSEADESRAARIRHDQECSKELEPVFRCRDVPTGRLARLEAVAEAANVLLVDAWTTRGRFPDEEHRAKRRVLAKALSALGEE